MTTIKDIDQEATIKYQRLLIRHGVSYLSPSHPDVLVLNRWYIDATNSAVGVGARTGYDDADGNVVPVGAAVDGEGKRVCRRAECGRVLVKKPGRGRWPVECRDGEGCKAPVQIEV